jgi:dolichyl-phosphate-mannose-protein mannosyltransferase
MSLKALKKILNFSGITVSLIILFYILAKILCCFSNSWIILHFLRFTSVFLILTISAGAGFALIKKLSILSDCSIYNFCLSITSGLVIIGFSVFLSLIKVNGWNIFLPLSGIVILVSIRELYLNSHLIIPRSPDKFKDIRGLNLLIIIILACLFSYSLYRALCPPISWDAQVYHLLIPRIYLENSGFKYIPLNVYSNMPHSMDLLFLAGMAVGDDVTAKLLHFSLGILLCLSMYAICKKNFSTRCGLIAPLLFISSPMIFFEFGVAFIDIGLSLFCLWNLAMIISFIKKGKVGYCFLAGLFCGMGMSSKYTLFFTATSSILLLISAPFILRENKDVELQCKRISPWNYFTAVFIFSGASLIILMPWLIKSLYYTGNPIYPMMYKYFGGRDWSEKQGAWLIDWQHSIGMGRSITDYILLPFRVFFKSSLEKGYQGFAGTLYPYILILLPSCYFIRKKKWIIISCFLFFAVYFIQWAMGAQQVRFLFPVIPALAICSAAGVASLKKRNNILYFISIVIVLLAPVHLIIKDILPGIMQEGSFIPVLSGRETRETFLRPRMRTYPCFEYLKENCAETDTVLFLFENRGYYCSQPFFADAMFEASHFMNLALEAGSPDEFRKKIESYNAKYIVVDELIRESINKYDKKTLFSKKNNINDYIKALDLIELFMQLHLEVVFEENHARIYKLVEQ